MEALKIELTEHSKQEQTLNNWTKDITDSLQSLQDSVKSASYNCQKQLHDDKKSVKKLLKGEHQMVELESTKAGQLLSRTNDQKS